MNKRANNICKMIKGDKETIKECLFSESKYVRMDAILWAAYHKFKDTDITERIVELKSDFAGGLGYTVSNYAISALDILEIEKYTGKDESQIALIHNFLPTKELAELAYKQNYNNN